jgi:arsenate reductase
MLFPEIKLLCEELSQQFSTLPEARKQNLRLIADYIQAKKDASESVNLVYICTHNSRRSHFGQTWSAVAAAYYRFSNVHTFSGGTEATAFHPNAIEALRELGFQVEGNASESNPVYTVKFGDHESTECFSKVYDHISNPQAGFAAIMTCSDAEENCPFIPGVELRVATTYNDPKAFDGTSEQQQAYRERSNQIALETLYVFSLIH